MKGIGFNDEHAQIIGETVAEMVSKHGRGISSDVSGWETTYGIDYARLHAQYLNDSCENPMPGYLNACLVWAETTMTVPLILPDGVLYLRNRKQLMTSGNYNTTEGNGSGRAGAAAVIGTWPRTQGDDCLEFTNKSLEEVRLGYEKAGLNLRDVVEIDPNNFVFCSHRFFKENGAWKVVLNDLSRTLYEICSLKIHDHSSDVNWLDEVRHDSDLSERMRGFLADRFDYLQHRAQRPSSKDNA
jgi:hypothetical protein